MNPRPAHFRYTDEQLEQWTAFYEAYPGWRKRWELVTEYARSKAGLTLDFWRNLARHQRVGAASARGRQEIQRTRNR